LAVFFIGSLKNICWENFNSFSAAIGVKMNILLFAPALFFILLLSNGITDSFCLLFVCGFVQV